MKNLVTGFRLTMLLAAALLAACAAPTLPAQSPEPLTPTAVEIATSTAVVKVVDLATPAPSQPAPQKPSPAPTLAGPLFNTAIGGFVYDSARFVNEVNGTRPAAGCKLLLVALRRPDGAQVDLQKWSEAHLEIFIRGDDGSQTLSTMGGFAGGQFVIGFQVPETVKTYQLIWGVNDPLTIIPEE